MPVEAKTDCPICSVGVETAGLEAHLRQELCYPSVRCNLCPLRFFSVQAASRHFEDVRSGHPSHLGGPDLSGLEPEPTKDARLQELLSLAEKG